MTRRTTEEVIEFVSKEETNCGRVWRWSKKRFIWHIRIDGQTVVVEGNCSWRSEKCRVAVNGSVVRYGSLVGLKEYEFDFFHLGIPFVVKIVGHSADLLIDGVPADWYTQIMRTQQESLYHSIQNSLPSGTLPFRSVNDYSVFLDTPSVHSESAAVAYPSQGKHPLLTL